MAQNTALSAAATALVAVRGYRRPVPPKPPRAPRRRKTDIAPRPASLIPTALPGVPLDWSRGVGMLAILPAPPGIPPRRWTILAVTSARLLRDHGAALHGAGWDALDLFGLHSTAPATNPPGWGLAWLLWEHGEVLDVGPYVIGVRRSPDGARLAYRRSASGRCGAVLAWLLA